MTLEEKVAQLIHVWGSVKDDDVLRTYGNTSVGAMYSAGLSANDTCNAIVRCRTQVRAHVQLYECGVPLPSWAPVGGFSSIH